jgi:glycosyltransferase involved in cell wall biosynthesis
MPKVSIIIPCYNHGKYIYDAINSVGQIKDKSLYELIIVNDGSTDEFTNQQLTEISQKGYKVIFQQNQGLAKSRNNAIQASAGEYILPLDADNKIRPEYVYKGIDILDRHKDVAIVYGDAELFGEKRGIMKQGPYNLQKLMLANYIDACAIYRRSVWDQLGGYDSDMPAAGIEDWNLWLSASFHGFKFHYIDEILFDYRVLGTSMIRNLKADKLKGDANIDYMIKKYPAHFGPQHIDTDIMEKFNQSNIGFVLKLFLKRYFPAKFSELVAKGKLRKYI